ncbi:hypothetical protein RchiOBHm_Chr1g0342151 [Rosa chinensis]|uniref:Uncharacterized protein n=1 Tax=Rosa chinensis TaxID=74649 RepID=A0A2P6SDY0_ROSCH|nr:hypothetical protein RchiOBHm_Chr1g0342151 [Rosa chinensis]
MSNIAMSFIIDLSTIRKQTAQFNNKDIEFQIISYYLFASYCCSCLFCTCVYTFVASYICHVCYISLSTVIFCKVYHNQAKHNCLCNR